MTTLDMLGEEGEFSDESLDEVDIDPAQTSAQADSNKFDMLCDGLMSSLALVQSSLSEFLYLKDELMQHSLPPSLLARLAMVTSRIFRSATDLHCPASELVRLVRVYSPAWEDKSAALKKLHSDYESKHKQLNIAIRRLQLIDAQARRMAKERRIMMWEKLFSKLTSARGHGRRWKFLIDNFKQKSKLGMEHLQAYIDSLDNESGSEAEERDEETPGVLEGAAETGERGVTSSLSNSVNELQTISSSDEELEFSDESSYGYSGDESGTPTGVKKVTFQEPSAGMGDGKGVGVPVYVEVPAPKPPTSERAVWTHEPQYDYFLNAKVYQPLGIQIPDVRCSLTFQQQFMKTEVFTEEKPASRGTGKPQSTTASPKRSSLIGSRERVGNSRQKQRSTSQLGDSCFVLTFPVGDKPLFEETEDEAPPTESSAGLEDEGGENSMKVGIHQGEFDELVAMGTIGFEDLKSLNIQLVEVIEETQPFSPTPFPVYKVTTGRKSNQDEPPVRLPLLFYYTRVLKPFTKEGQTESESVNDIVFDLTGVDLNILNKEDLSVNKEYKERCVSVMTVRSTQSERENVVPRSDLELLMTQHEEEIKMIHEEYENRIRELTGSLEELQDEQMKALLERKGRASTSQGGGGDCRIPENGSLSPVKKIKTPSNTPKWGSDLPSDFLERLQQFTEESQKRRDQLTEKTRKEVEGRLEKQLAVQYRLSMSEGDRRAALKDVSIPAVFMPCRTGQIYNPRAHQYFHSTGSLGQLRLTQPPSIFQLPPLPSKNRVSVLNLFDIKRNYSFRGAEDTSMSRATTASSSRPASSQQPMSLSSRQTTVEGSD